jgi:hypothetical protein
MPIKKFWKIDPSDRENINIGDPWIYIPQGRDPKLVPEFTLEVIGVFPDAIHLKSKWEGYSEVHLSDLQDYSAMGIYLPLTPERMWDLQSGATLTNPREAAEKLLQEKSGSLTEGQWKALQFLLETF